MEKLIVVIYVILSLAVLAVTVVLLTRKKKEGYEGSVKKCVCSSTMDKRGCQDVDTVQDAYVNNVLTEYTNLKSPGWTKVSPGDKDYPVSEGCPWPDESNKKEWVSWDFTDFGG